MPPPVHCGDFHSTQDGRLLKSHLVEDSVRMVLGTTSFIPGTWECIACDSHRILPKRRNLDQWKGGPRLVILADQNMPPLVPSANVTCPAVIRVEEGSVGELGDSLCSLLGEYTLPEGSVIAIGSLSYLQKAGITAYANKLVTECRRFQAMFRNQVVVVPFAPLPLCGTNNPNLIKLLMDFSLYMDNMNSSCLNGFNALIREYINEFVLESDFLLDHTASGVSLPNNSLEHTHKLYTCSSWTSLPSLLPAMNVAWESKLLTAFLSSLCTRYNLELETPHAVDRSIYAKAAATGSSAALVLGGSNAGKLVDALVAGGCWLVHFGG